MIKQIDVRFFVLAEKDGEVDFFEVTESCFIEFGGNIEYTRHTVWQNGCNQVCLYKRDVDGWPDWSDLDTID